MKIWMRWCRSALVALSIALSGIPVVHSQMKAGEPAPLFVLNNSQGKSFDLAGMKTQPMLILYFFDVASRPSQEGLLSLDQLAKKYKEADLAVWGITRSDADQVSRFLSQTQLGFPVLVDDGHVFEQYAVRIILPTACIVGPDLKLLDYFQGGGKTTESLLVTLAERKLQRRQINIAKALSNEVTQKDPGNARAKSVQGHAELKEGDLKAAESTFSSLSHKKGDAEILGKEGLSQVYAQKGEPDRAMTMAREVERKAGDRAYAHVVQGDLLYSQNQTKEAEAEYKKAIEKTGGSATQRATAFNQLGRMYAVRGDYPKSLGMYDQALSLDPYYVEATSNKGMTYERQGQWDQALASYQEARTIDQADPFAATLAANANKMILMEIDPDRRRQIEVQIDTYAQNYKGGVPATGGKSEDPWASGEVVQVMLVEPVETGGLAIRDGFPKMLILHLADQLNASGRIGVVEPLVLDRVVHKVGLTQSDLAAPDTCLKLARACGAMLVAKGTLFHLSEGTLLKYKLIDAGRKQEFKEINRQFASTATLAKDMHWLNREMLLAIMGEYPLQGYVVQINGHEVLINLGRKQGVVVGSLFDVVEDKPVVEFRGTVMKPEATVMATLEVVRVQEASAYAHILEQRRQITVEDKLRENIRVLKGEPISNW
jgi:tetratricopeptide (TPR) repeat protein